MAFNLRATFDREFDQIRQDLAKMGELVGEAIGNAMQSLVERDQQLAEEIIANDAQINDLRFQIEEACLALIATQQPAASDLREIVAIMHMVVEMERMGDHAAGIAKTVIMMSEEPLLKTLKKIPKMGEISRQMLADSIQAFAQRDIEWARQIAAQDSKMDELYQDVFHRLIKIMAKKPDMVTRCTYLMWSAHNLERIADRVTNIAEQIVFMTTGNLGELQP
jgi:phosphate transport system protein